MDSTFLKWCQCDNLRNHKWLPQVYFHFYRIITYNKKVDGKYFLRKHKTYLYWGAKAQTLQHYYLLALID